MNATHNKAVALTCSSETSAGSAFASPSLESDCSASDSSKFLKSSPLSSFFASAFSAFWVNSDSSKPREKKSNVKSNGWSLVAKRIVLAGSMRRIHECVMGPSKTGVSGDSDIWFLGVCYKISQDESSQDQAANSGLAAFMQDFSSRILVTYRKGFDPIGDAKFTTDASWGCMLRSSQMLVAQALLFHRLGRSWRKKLSKERPWYLYPLPSATVQPLDQDYVEILHSFGDSEASVFSIHNLLEAGKAYGLVPGSWIGPYAMCCSWRSLSISKGKEPTNGSPFLPMAVYVVSGDANGERGGAPVVCIDDASRHCSEFSKGEADWTPLLLLVPLVIGLDKVNPRYIPSLQATFSFPQSLGILGGKPGASTYIVGVQGSDAFYLDPHYCQQVANIRKEDLEADTSSYHTDIIRHIRLDLIDPSLAIGFYCRDKDDFDDFCSRASKLADESNGAPLFTVAQGRTEPNLDSHGDGLGVGVEDHDELLLDMPAGEGDGRLHEDEWQLL